MVVRFFKQRHIEIKAPEAVFLNEERGMLFVRATQADQDKIEKLVGGIIQGQDLPIR